MNSTKKSTAIRSLRAVNKATCIIKQPKCERKDMNINTKKYWDARFSTGDWERNKGFEQTQLFAQEQANLMKPYIKPTSRILDFGCGAGDSAPVFKEQFPDCQFFGEDLSDQAIHLATERYGTLALFSTGFESDLKFDIILTSNVLEHVDDYHHVCQNLLKRCQILFVFVPYLERPLSKEHVRMFDASSFSSYGLIDKLVYKSQGWSYFGWSYFKNIILKNLIRPIIGKPIKHQNWQAMYVIKGDVCE